MNNKTILEERMLQSFLYTVKKGNDPYGRTKLFYLIMYNSDESLIVNEIINKDKRDVIRFRDYTNNSYLSFSCQRHFLTVIRLLIELGVDINDCNPLLSALGVKNNKNVEILQIFIEHGVNLNKTINSKGDTLKEIIYSFKDDDLIRIINNNDTKFSNNASEHHIDDVYIETISNSYKWNYDYESIKNAVVNLHLNNEKMIITKNYSDNRKDIVSIKPYENSRFKKYNDSYEVEMIQNKNKTINQNISFYQTISIIQSILG